MSMWFQNTHLLLHQASFQYPCFQHKLNTRQVLGITFAFEDQAKTKKKRSFHDTCCDFMSGVQHQRNEELAPTSFWCGHQEDYLVCLSE